MYICNGKFGPETLALLKDAYARKGLLALEVSGRYQCVDCGRGDLAATHHRGEWVPVAHEKVWRQPVKAFHYFSPPKSGDGGVAKK